MFAGTPQRADYALAMLHSHLIQSWYWFEEYQIVTGRKLLKLEDLSPPTRDFMDRMITLLSLLKSMT